MKKNDSKELTLVDHLDELRNHIIFVLLIFLVATVLSFNYADRIVDDMVSKAVDMQFVYLSPAELFTSYLRIAMLAGFAVALPFLLYRLWLFIKPGLYQKERTAIKSALATGFLLFLTGVVFAYEVVLPMSLQFFAEFQIESIQSAVGFANYFQYALSLVIAFGVVFELPIVVALIISLGIVEADTMRKNRKYIFIVVLIAASILTPPDVISQILLTVPMVLLFELGIFFGAKFQKEKDT